jgi:hypothetical protein
VPSGCHVDEAWEWHAKSDFEFEFELTGQGT